MTSQDQLSFLYFERKYPSLCLYSQYPLASFQTESVFPLCHSRKFNPPQPHSHHMPPSHASAYVHFLHAQKECFALNPFFPSTLCTCTQRLHPTLSVQDNNLTLKQPPTTSEPQQSHQTTASPPITFASLISSLLFAPTVRSLPA